ncbi:MAG: divalent-cation tolerance protein CutA [Rickettsiaceae bacterium]|nr:divalent-cation tolerance protein CutA [Rickettsiaceae bacterium]
MNKICCIVVTTTDNERTARLIATTLLEKGLAACVQLDKVQSFFYHEEERKNQLTKLTAEKKLRERSVKEAEEIRLFIKAPIDNYKAIEESIKLNHNYQLPQIIKLDITDGLPEYLNWVHASKCI